ncbi:MAG: thiamine pyrophosphate-dependent dehydrogenase E1 component subunit alpha [Sneathiella sp.]|nr:thiamine pyrophosphate-dependent dehydrogenase E1 component subunit alpha [Sneathiella sp.]MDF2368978.1 thiamine pyrophosphate-dependent dehydrogenase E1 component subunit alpha [Sneathiella sp.]
MSPTKSDNSVPISQLLEFYERMLLVREAENRLSKLFADGEVPGFIHLSVGQEAVCVGVTSALETRDTLASNHRGHGHALSKGVELNSFFLEVMGKEEGICGGRGGSMHVADMSVGMLGANGIVGAGIPLAVGSALAHQVQENGAIAVAFFGDGALAEGVLHESFNLAALWKLPILFVCENNGWSEFSPTGRQFNANVRELAGVFGIPSAFVDGDDVLAVNEAASELVTAIRAGEGPYVLECVTHRVRGHFEGDPQKYRAESEINSLPDHDPITKLETIISKRRIPKKEVVAIRGTIEARINAAVEAGRGGNAPDFSRAKADVYTAVEEV